MKVFPCYLRCGREAEGYSAYCTACQPKPDPSRPHPQGRKQCVCGGCAELFTTPRTFDSHQSLGPSGLVCKDPRRMFDKNQRRKLVLTTRGWAKNPDLEGFNTFARAERA